MNRLKAATLAAMLYLRHLVITTGYAFFTLPSRLLARGQYTKPTLRAPLTAQCSSSDVQPLLQRIYDQLSEISNADSASVTAALPALAELVSTLQPSDFGLREADYAKLRRSVYITVLETEAFDLAVIIMPQGDKLDIHDHPHMHVVSKLLFGEAKLQSFDWADAAATVDAGCCRKAKVVGGSSRTLSSSTPAWTLTPTESNMHEVLIPTSGVIMYTKYLCLLHAACIDIEPCIPSFSVVSNVLTFMLHLHLFDLH
jgi:PCO_ADO